MTLKEIAREAGVSAMTVSNVVNHNDAKVSEETRKRVQAVIDKYGSEPLRPEFSDHCADAADPD